MDNSEVSLIIFTETLVGSIGDSTQRNIRKCDVADTKSREIANSDTKFDKRKQARPL